jgi:phosphomannomutase
MGIHWICRSINGDIWEIEGEHSADPSKEKNLEELKTAIENEGADFGIAFDLDGDRGAIVVPCRSADSKITFETLAPDNLIVVLLPYLIEKCGYQAEATGKQTGVIRDVLGGFAVNDMAEQLGVDPFQTDSGYVFLKAKRQKLLEQNYVIPIYGERSGHCWMDVTGEIENPLAVAVIFAVMVKKAKYSNDRTESTNSCYEAYMDKTIPYRQSPRFQPAFHPALLEKLSLDPRNNTGWRFDPNKPKSSPAQALIALGKDTGIKELKEEFVTGKVYQTPAGELMVREFNFSQDSEEEGGLYRFADIIFEINGEFAGRFVFRASSNDPTFVCSYETPIKDGETENSKTVHDRKISVGGVILSWLEDNGYALVTKENLQAFLGLGAEEADKKSKDSNLGVVEKDLIEYREFVSDRSSRGSSADKVNKAIAKFGGIEQILKYEVKNILVGDINLGMCRAACSLNLGVATVESLLRARGVHFALAPPKWSIGPSIGILSRNGKEEPVIILPVYASIDDIAHEIRAVIIPNLTHRENVAIQKDPHYLRHSPRLLSRIADIKRTALLYEEYTNGEDFSAKTKEVKWFRPGNFSYPATMSAPISRIGSLLQKSSR